MPHPPQEFHRLRAAFLGFAIFIFAGCASTGRIQQQLAQQMIAGDYGTALQLVEQQKASSFRGNNRLLYYLERGMLLHVDGQFAESNAAFEQAKRIGRDLYTKSLSNEGFALITNDYSLPYAGENFERTLIHLFSAMNYVSLNDSSSALVEVRQVGEYLRKLQVDSPKPNVYQEDAFARYVSALLYEASGEFESAFVDFKKAADAYRDYESVYSVPRPDSLLENAERVAARLGEWAKHDLQKRGSSGAVRRIPEGSGELVILHYNGLVPAKAQTKIAIPFSEAWPLVAALHLSRDDVARNDLNEATLVHSQIAGTDVVSVAFPKYVVRPYSIDRMEPYVEGASQIVGPELVEDIGAIAMKDLADRIGRIRTRSIIRATIKFAIQKGAELAAQDSAEDYGDLLTTGAQIIGNIARYVSEQADKRIWSTLPDEIWMASMILPAGQHNVKVDFKTVGSAVVESQVIPGVTIAPGERQFVIVRTVK